MLYSTTRWPSSSLYWLPWWDRLYSSDVLTSPSISTNQNFSTRTSKAFATLSWRNDKCNSPIVKSNSNARSLPAPTCTVGSKNKIGATTRSSIRRLTSSTLSRFFTSTATVIEKETNVSEELRHRSDAAGTPRTRLPVFRGTLLKTRRNRQPRTSKRYTRNEDRKSRWTNGLSRKSSFCEVLPSNFVESAVNWSVVTVLLATSTVSEASFVRLTTQPRRRRRRTQDRRISPYSPAVVTLELPIKFIKLFVKGDVSIQTASLKSALNISSTLKLSVPTFTLAISVTNWKLS